MRNITSIVLMAATLALGAATESRAETAIFAGGCFWCVESDLDHVKGVAETTSGYAGGTQPDPSYTNHEGYTEAVKVEFDPAVISYEALTAHFLRTIDVVDGGGQFCDRGPSYVPALFPLTPGQTQAANRALGAAEKALGQKLAVKVSGTTSFYPAEDYHQNYYVGTELKITRFGLVRQSDAYARYRNACGRDARVEALWGEGAYTYPVTSGSGS